MDAVDLETAASEFRERFISGRKLVPVELHAAEETIRQESGFLR